MKDCAIFTQSEIKSLIPKTHTCCLRKHESHSILVLVQEEPPAAAVLYSVNSWRREKNT